MSALEEILDELEGTGRVPRERVLGWMGEESLEALGALSSLLWEGRGSRRVEPPLYFEEHQAFAKHYLGRCLREDREGEWADSAYSAGYSLLVWLAGTWRERVDRPEALDDWKGWLAELYRAGDASLRTCLVDATLEHLFEIPEVSQYFRDWKDDPVLEEAYERALGWVEGGGTLLGGEEWWRDA